MLNVFNSHDRSATTKLHHLARMKLYLWMASLRLSIIQAQSFSVERLL